MGEDVREVQHPEVTVLGLVKLQVHAPKEHSHWVTVASGYDLLGIGNSTRFTQ
jgi:hypothetical protein